MDELDWEKISRQKISLFDEDELQELVAEIIECQGDGIENVGSLRALFRISQQLLQHKDNQVQLLLDENNNLKEKLRKLPVAAQRKKVEKAKRDDDDYSKEYSSKLKTLMQELQDLEVENANLKSKLEGVSDEMSDAIDKMNETTEQLESYRGTAELYKDKIVSLERENQALFIRINEMAAQQMNRDKVIDEFEAAIEDRVTEWKGLLERRDAEINQLKQQLSQALTQTMVAAREQNKCELVNLNEEIDRRDQVIREFQLKLKEATEEINLSTEHIQKLKEQLKRLEKSDNGKAQRYLTKKLHEANKRIKQLQNSLKQTECDASLKGKEFYDLLMILRKYENESESLTEALSENRELKEDLDKKTVHVKDLIDIINNFESLNAHHEMEIEALRESLSIPPEQEIATDFIALRRKEQTDKLEEALKKNEILMEENLNLKADIRTMRYKLSQASQVVEAERSESGDQVDADKNELMRWRETEIDEIKRSVQLVIEENEQLRNGMHEILDSINNQDGKSEVKIESDTLERLLEAFDSRHLAGWYHPAMRLQERLNVIRGSNAELRSELRLIRKEVERKDAIISKVAMSDDNVQDRSESIESSEAIQVYSEIRNLHDDYKKELEDWNEEKQTLIRQIDDLRESNDSLQVQLREYQQNWQIIESGGDELQKSLAVKVRDCAEAKSREICSSRRCQLLIEVLRQESEKTYKFRKDSIAAEREYKREILQLDKANKILEGELTTLRSNHANSVSLFKYTELREKFEDVVDKYRETLEDQMRDSNNSTVELERVEFGGGDAAQVGRAPERRILEKLNECLNCQPPTSAIDESREIDSLRAKVLELSVEVDSLSRSLRIAEDENKDQYELNVSKTLELDNLRHQILDLQAISEDKETIARLGFEVAHCKSREFDEQQRMGKLTKEIDNLREELTSVKSSCQESLNKERIMSKQCSERAKSLLDLMGFVRQQYAASVPLGTLERFNGALKRLKSDRETVKLELREIDALQEAVKEGKGEIELRLELVDRLKQMLEEAIGNPAIVDELLQRHSDHSSHTLAEFRCKRKISHLERELEAANGRSSEYEAALSAMERDMIYMQSLWNACEVVGEKSKNESIPPVKCTTIETQTIWDRRAAQVQCAVDKVDKSVGTTISEDNVIEPGETTVTYNADDKSSHETVASKLAEAMEELTDCKSQLDKWKARVEELERDVTADKSLQQIIAQKDATIEKYQNLLREERDKHNARISQMQEDIRFLEDANDKSLPVKSPVHRVKKTFNASVMDENAKESQSNNKVTQLEEEVLKLSEQVKSLQDDLIAAKDLGERWHGLAEDRLKNIDHTRDKLSEQHKCELESYKVELGKWKTETDILREQLSESRVQLTRGNVAVAKDLRERDRKIQELTFTCQNLQTTLDLVESSQQSARTSEDFERKVREIHGVSRDTDYYDNNYKCQVEVLRRQIQNLTEKERNHKREITELKNQLSKRYMAVKAQDKKTTQREVSLEKKLKTMEDELTRTKAQLERESHCQEARRIKTAGDVALWEKQKKWQQTAENLRERFREKSDECKKLQINNDKLRALVSCMEREKWFLRSKLKCDNNDNASNARGGNLMPMKFNNHPLQINAVEEMQKECHALRERVKELTDRLEGEIDARALLQTVDEQKRRIAILEGLANGDLNLVDQVEKLETSREALERINLRLEGENVDLRLEMERLNVETPRMREKIQHLEKYVELLKSEKSLVASPRLTDKDREILDRGSKRTITELERTIFSLKKIVEKLQAENKRLKLSKTKYCHRFAGASDKSRYETESMLRGQYEKAKQRVVALETDLKLAEQRIAMLERSGGDYCDEGDDDQVSALKQQLEHKSELLHKMKQLLTRAAINEKNLRHRIVQLERDHTLDAIQEGSSSPDT